LIAASKLLRFSTRTITMAHRAGSGLGGKLFLALLGAALAGYGWACFETGRNPLDVLKLFASPEPAPEPVDDPEGVPA